MSGIFGTTVIKGNRLTDFTNTTATVGTTIPWGAGRFVVPGNVIWAALPPKTQRKLVRQGKGGVKQETFTYTMSYAVGFSKAIYGYWWIKRNGKIVYTNDPNAPIEDKQYAAKWLQKATLYIGGEDQLPDPTIESYEGMGQVPAHKDIAYIVLEDDDVTNEGGAVPSYEACVIASPPDVFLTSKPYQIVDQNDVDSSSQPMWMNNARQPFITENVEAGSDLEFAELLVVVHYLTYDLPPEDEAVCDSDFESGELLRVVNYLTYLSPPDEAEADGDFMSGELEVVAGYLFYTNWPQESMVASGDFESGSLTEV